MRELVCLLEGVLSRRGIEDEQHLVGVSTERLLHAAVTAVRTVAFQPPDAGFGDVLEEEFAAHCSVESASGK